MIDSSLISTIGNFVTISKYALKMNYDPELKKVIAGSKVNNSGCTQCLKLFEQVKYQKEVGRKDTPSQLVPAVLRSRSRFFLVGAGSQSRIF